MLLGHGVKQQWFMRPSFRAKVTVMATWLFLATFLVLAYTNIFFSLLVTTTYEKPIDTVEDLLNHQAYSSYCTEITLYYWTLTLYFQISPPTVWSCITQRDLCSHSARDWPSRQCAGVEEEGCSISLQGKCSKNNSWGVGAFTNRAVLVKKQLL